jgi:hypothetical protein
MAQMDHNEAVRLQAAEKYVLGEIPQNLREEYEEHFFDCAECALDIKAAAAFADTSGELLRAERSNSLERNAIPARGGWFAWFRPIVAVPAFAVLLLLLGYQNFLALQNGKAKPANGAAQILFSSYSLRGVNTAGEEGRTLSIRPGEAFLLNFDFVPTLNFDSYIGQLQDAVGHVLLEAKIAGGNANREAHLLIPAGMLHPGKYVLAFYGDPGGAGKINAQDDAGRLPFTVEFRP